LTTSSRGQTREAEAATREEANMKPATSLAAFLLPLFAVGMISASWPDQNARLTDTSVNDISAEDIVMEWACYGGKDQ